MADDQIANTGFSILFVLEKQISGYLPASGPIKNQIDLDTFLVTLFDMLCSTFTRCFCFHFARSLTVGFTIGEAISKREDIAVGLLKFL